MSTTARRKFGSSSDGLATKSTPFPTDICANSMLARAGIACRTVKNPASRRLAVALHIPAELGALEQSDGGSIRELPHDGEMASIV